MLRRAVIRIAVVAAMTVMLPWQTVANAESLQSPHYKFDESSLGAGGLNHASSANFSGNGSVGSLGVGNSASQNFQVEAGPNTTKDPTLSFTIINADADFGNFTASGATTATASFSVSNYTSYGYVVQIIGNPPKNGGHTIPALSTQTESQSGVEQFGINLVANTEPATVGADPDNGDFGHGQVAPNYATPDRYRYVSGDTIAYAEKSSGITIYTITYLVNVDSLTPGGQYTSDQTLVVTGTY